MPCTWHHEKRLPSGSLEPSADADGVDGAERATEPYLPQLSLSPVILLNTGVAVLWSLRSATK